MDASIDPCIALIYCSVLNAHFFMGPVTKPLDYFIVGCKRLLAGCKYCTGIQRLQNGKKAILLLH